MRGLAKIARDLGDGDIRLTVWQNLLISGVADDKVALAEAAIEALGLATKATSIRAGLVACTGNVGCRFAASDTKRHAEEIARWCEARVELDGPVNIHLTGCHHSCAQHYIGDIGLLGLQGRGVGRGRPGRGLSHLCRRRLRPRRRARPRNLSRREGARTRRARVERMLKGYLAHRASREETFLAFSRRHEVEALKAMFDAEAAE